MTISPRLTQQDRGVVNVSLFSSLLRFCWYLLFLITIAWEVIPRSPSLAPLPYYAYTSAKAILFVLVGFLSPLSFWRFDSLGLGLFCCAAAAGGVEYIQTFSEGHQGSYLEFAAKLVLLFLGFAVALNARYDRLLNLGPIHIRFVDSHRPELNN